MKPVRLSLFALLVAFTVSAHSESSKHFRAKLVGIKEVPAVFTSGKAEFKARANDAGTAIQFELSYKNLTGAPSAAHVHFGQPDVNGGVSFFLCSAAGAMPPPPPGTQVCPQATSASFSGTITAADVIGPAAQGIAPGDLAAILQMMKAEVTYANIHTAKFPNGEIRGQVKVEDDD